MQEIDYDYYKCPYHCVRSVYPWQKNFNNAIWFFHKLYKFLNQRQWLP